MFLLETIIGTVAPLECVVCSRQGQALCSACCFDMLSRLPSRCFRCYRRTRDYRTCSKCAVTSPLLHVWVASEYNLDIAAVVKSYKFARNRALARPLAELTSAGLPYFRHPPVVVAVPTATTRVRQRGYDHALLLARALAEHMVWPHAVHLRRTSQTRQVGMGRITRFNQLKGAFRVVRTESLGGKNIILVDDVVTTGATLSEAARILSQAGAKSVSAAVIAQRS